MGDRERLSRAATSKAFDHASGSFLGPEAAAALAAATESHCEEEGVALGLAGRTDHYPDYWPELGVVLGLAGRTDHHLDY